MLSENFLITIGRGLRKCFHFSRFFSGRPFFEAPNFDHQFDHQNYCRPSPRHVSTLAPRTLRIWPGKSATAQRMAALPSRSELALGVPPYDPGGPSSFSTQMPGSTAPENGKLPTFPLPRMVGLVPFWFPTSKRVLPYKPTLS